MDSEKETLDSVEGTPGSIHAPQVESSLSATADMEVEDSATTPSSRQTNWDQDRGVDDDDLEEVDEVVLTTGPPDVILPTITGMDRSMALLMEEMFTISLAEDSNSGPDLWTSAWITENLTEYQLQADLSVHPKFGCNPLVLGMLKDSCQVRVDMFLNSPAGTQQVEAMVRSFSSSSSALQGRQ